jgi:hypothetical protein
VVVCVHEVWCTRCCGSALLHVLYSACCAAGHDLRVSSCGSTGSGLF